MTGKREIMYSVFEDDVSVFLNKIGILKKINAGEIFCHNCKKVITVENFGSILRLNSEYIVSCDEFDCSNKMNSCKE